MRVMLCVLVAAGSILGLDFGWTVPAFADEETQAAPAAPEAPAAAPTPAPAPAPVRPRAVAPKQTPRPMPRGAAPDSAMQQALKAADPSALPEYQWQPPQWLEALWWIAKLGNTTHVYISLPLIASLAAMVMAVMPVTRGKGRFAKWEKYTAMGLLSFAALAAVGNYLFYEEKLGNLRYNTFFNGYEFYHYYIGTKYAHEVGYTNMYAATIVADAETGMKFNDRSGTIRNLANGRHDLTVRQVLANKDSYKALFTPERWSEFVKDITWFKGLSQMNPTRWSNMLRDKGYNSTPIWSMTIGTLFSNRFSTQSGSHMQFLAFLDVFLLIAATGFVIWAFDTRAALFLLVLLGTHYVMHWWHMKGAFLRTDFAVSLVIATCLLKKEKYVPAGLFTAWAFCSRVFPGVFLFGIGSKVLWELYKGLEAMGRGEVSEKSLDRAMLKRYVQYFAAFAGLVLVLAVLSLTFWRGWGLWHEFIAKIGFHNSSISTWRLGFKYLFMGGFPDNVGWLTPFGEWVPQCRSDWYKFEQYRILYHSIQLGVLVVCLLAARGLKPHQAMVLGFVPCFFLAAATYYYFILLIVPMLYFAEEPERISKAYGIMLMLVTGSLGYIFYHTRGSNNREWQQDYGTYYWTGWLILAMAALMVALSLYEGRSVWLARGMILATALYGGLLSLLWPLGDGNNRFTINAIGVVMTLAYIAVLAFMEFWPAQAEPRVQRALLAVKRVVWPEPASKEESAS